MQLARRIDHRQREQPVLQEHFGRVPDRRRRGQRENVAHHDERDWRSRVRHQQPAGRYDADQLARGVNDVEIDDPFAQCLAP